MPKNIINERARESGSKTLTCDDVIVRLISGMSSPPRGAFDGPFMDLELRVAITGEDVKTLIEHFPEDTHRNTAQLVANMVHAYAWSLRSSGGI